MKRKLAYQTLLVFMFLTSIIILTCSCSKNQSTNNTVKDVVYSSITDFHTKNEVAMQLFSVTASTGGTYTSPQGTIVKIPANAFVDNNGLLISGLVNIEFKDIYKKSDMLLSDKPTISYTGIALKSGGEFFIRAKQGTVAVNVNPNFPIVIIQPSPALADTAMKPFIGGNQAMAGGKGNFVWMNDKSNLIKDSASNYIFSLYKFNNPVDSGSWCNSDNPNYFAGYTQTILTMHPLDNPDSFSTEVFLIFKNINSMVHVYRSYTGIDFPYNYAPVGLQCTVVAIGVKGGQFYSSFTPITISSNQIVNFTFTTTTTADFISQVALLN